MKHDYSFLKHNRIKNTREVDHMFNEWRDHMHSGDETQVRLTDFVLSRDAPETKEHRPMSYVFRVQGYQIIRIDPFGSAVVAAYSPLAKSMLVNGRLRYFYVPSLRGPEPLPLAEADVGPLVFGGAGLDPLNALDDDQSKRLLMASDNPSVFRTLCAYPRHKVVSYVASYVCKPMGLDDPTLATVKYIRTQLPEPNYKRLMDVYDTFGPTDTVVGDALTHLDKFRSF